jgi:hypothetical protein
MLRNTRAYSLSCQFVDKSWAPPPAGVLRRAGPWGDQCVAGGRPRCVQVTAAGVCTPAGTPRDLHQRARQQCRRPHRLRHQGEQLPHSFSMPCHLAADSHQSSCEAYAVHCKEYIADCAGTADGAREREREREREPAFAKVYKSGCACYQGHNSSPPVKEDDLV